MIVDFLNDKESKVEIRFWFSVNLKHKIKWASKHLKENETLIMKNTDRHMWLRIPLCGLILIMRYPDYLSQLLLESTTFSW